MKSEAYINFFKHYLNGSVGYLEIELVLTQLTFTCSKSIIEALEKGVKYIQS